MPNEPLSSGDDSLILQLLDIVAQRLHQLLTQGIILEGPEAINQTQQKIDRLRQQLERLRIVLRKQKEIEKRKRQLSRNTA
jgi:lipid II:glycine glycyltransferase (peptidoglycan interpeptide bridge formation enzyme)